MVRGHLVEVDTYIGGGYEVKHTFMEYVIYLMNVFIIYLTYFQKGNLNVPNDYYKTLKMTLSFLP